MRLYVDGCSYTAGYGLDPCYSLASLLGKELNLSKASIIDNSYPGKSNYAMALDLYSMTEQCDYYVIGWSYSNRYEFLMDDTIVTSSISKNKINLGNRLNEDGEFLEKEYTELQSRFFKYSSRLSTLSDYLIDSSAAMLTNTNKKFCYFSWEQRKVNTTIIYPFFGKQYRQKDTPEWGKSGHLNEEGMALLAKQILNKYYDK